MPKHSTAPRVSVGVPVYNGERHLAAALDSLLAQSFTDFEIVVSDNASTDATQSICQRYQERDKRVRYVRQPQNLGAAPNFNRVFELASGEYFRWHAHDDVCAPTFLEKCVAGLDAAPEVVLCVPKTGFIDDHGHPSRDYDHPLNLAAASPSERFLQLIFGGHIVVEIFGLIRSDILRQTSLIGSYVGSDLVLLAELALYGRFLELPEQLFFHREHEQRSVHAHRDPRARTAWFDSRRVSKRVYPTWRLLLENMKVIWKSRIPLRNRERLSLSLNTLRVSNWYRRQLWDELVSGIFS